MITLNNIVEEFQTFVDNNYFLNTFSYGSPSSVDLDKFTEYPLLHLVYTMRMKKRTVLIYTF